MRPVRHIVDTTMRDGEQSPGVSMSAAQKLELVKLLDDAGIYQIEAGIPAVGKSEIECIYQMMQIRKKTKISVWNRLIIEDIKKSIECRPDIIHISTPVSYTQIYSKLNKNKAWVIKNLTACIEYAVSRGYEVTVGFEDASRADIAFMSSLCQLIKTLGVSRIRFADTVGVLSPGRTFQAVHDIMTLTEMDVQIHTHSDLGMSIANAVAGAKAGAMYIDTTIRGIGERAGNCDFAKLIYVAESMFDMGIGKLDALRVQERAAEMIGLPSEPPGSYALRTKAFV